MIRHIILAAMRSKRPLLLVVACLAMLPIIAAVATAAEPFPGRVSEWNGFQRHDFELHDRPAIIVAPAEAATGRPWIWRARFFGHRPELDLALLQRGYHLVYCDVANLFGSPRAVQHWDACYKTLTTTYELAPRPVLEGMSRGGLIVFNWTAANPDKVSCLYVDAPVCDFKSWPGGKGTGKGSPDAWQRLWEAYGFASDAEALAWQGNPIDRAEQLARTKLPLFVVTGDADDVVPKEENIDHIIAAWKQTDAPLTVIVKPGIGHKHGLDDATPLVEFVVEHTQPPAK